MYPSRLTSLKLEHVDLNFIVFTILMNTFRMSVKNHGLAVHGYGEALTRHRISKIFIHGTALTRQGAVRAVRFS